MSDRLTYWKCRHCHGTGECTNGWSIWKCSACDGTGNAMVDGVAEAHKRRLAKVREANAGDREFGP